MPGALRILEDIYQRSTTAFRYAKHLPEDATSRMISSAICVRINAVQLPVIAGVNLNEWLCE